MNRLAAASFALIAACSGSETAKTGNTADVMNAIDQMDQPVKEPEYPREPATKPQNKKGEGGYHQPGPTALANDNEARFKTQFRIRFAITRCVTNQPEGVIDEETGELIPPCPRQQDIIGPF